MNAMRCKTNWRVDPPKSQDGGFIEIRTAEGAVLVAFLTISDVWEDGLGYDRMGVVLENGRPVYLHDYKGWRPLTSTRSGC